MTVATQTKSKSAATANKRVEFRLIVADNGNLLGRIYVPEGCRAGIRRAHINVISETRTGNDLIVIFASSLTHYAELLKKFPSVATAYRVASNQLLKQYTPEPVEPLPADFPFPAAPLPLEVEGGSAANPETPLPTEQPETVEQPAEEPAPVEEPELSGPRDITDYTKAELLILAEDLFPADKVKSLKRKRKGEILEAIQEVFSAAIAENIMPLAA